LGAQNSTVVDIVGTLRTNILKFNELGDQYIHFGAFELVFRLSGRPLAGPVRRQEEQDKVKIASIVTAGQTGVRVGLGIPGGRVVDMAAAAEALAGQSVLSAVGRSVKSFLEAGPVALDAARALLAEVEGAAKGGANPTYILDESEVHFLPPVPDPEKFLCVGKNYRDHLEELKRTDLIKELPNEPTCFVKLNAVLCSQDAEVARPDGITTFDYEPELAFVIGKPGYRIPKEDAMDHVVGITIFNDLTAREIQKREVVSGSKFWMSKNMPNFGPVGPYIVTKDDYADMNDLWIRCSVNGQQRTRFNTSGQIYRAPDIIEHFSRYMPLKAGDLFATGSAGGVAVGHANAAELFMKPGDLVEASLEGLVTLRTRIV
jgi:2-keto-4-pentenoate hydratase/2-oxohepta-3-ene-1,7-dioic acid hydratase in catechol pathway